MDKDYIKNNIIEKGIVGQLTPQSYNYVQHCL